MGTGSHNKKRARIKGSEYAPSGVSRPRKISSQANHPARTLLTTKLKKADDGKFTVVNRRNLSVANAPDIPVNDPRTTEQILEVWFVPADEYGWDEAYVNSFVEKSQRPPTEDPDDNKSKKQPGKGDTVIHEWTNEIDKYLRILITLEGRGSDPPMVCPGGCRGEPIYRCLCCDNKGLVCADCMRDDHKHLPLHRIEVWNGFHFERTSLKALGLRIQLGHPPGHECLVPSKAFNDDFIVIDCDMIHNVSIDYCSCGNTAKSEVEQLLERRLYPATIQNPKTAATFRALELFELLQYESKLSPYEFYNTISRLTDNTGLDPPKDRYPSLLRMVHEWRHSRMLKRAGKGHDPGGVASTGQGECALLCPPCPHPGINMAPGWEDEKAEMRHIHALNIGLDANYRLKRKDVSDDVADPGLSKGYAFFVNDGPFRVFLKDHDKDTEPKSDCSRHDAVNLADVRPGQGYAASGVATVECTRHNMKRPGGVCDLQKGERYCNMDYIAVSSLILFGLALLRTFIISYDIACQWSQSFFSRIAKINAEAPVLKPESITRFVVPKFHLPAHIPNCQTRFAFMFTPGAGLGDGEAPERGWADTNPLGPSTREMGPGSRRDTLDAHFQNYNWEKIRHLDVSLLKKMEIAVWEVADRILAHQNFEKGLAEKDPGQVAQWWQEVAAWERDPTASESPFNMTIATPSQCAVRKALSEEETADIAAGKSFSLSSDMSPSQLIARGIDLESDMRSLKHSLKQTWDHSGDRELTQVQLKSNTIVKKVDAWYCYLQLYVPASLVLREEFASSSKKTTKPYDLPLWLPSEIGRRAPVPKHLANIEYRLRTAQAQDALTTIRRNLQRRVTVWDLKDRWLRGQGAHTKALNLLSTLQKKIKSAKEEYVQARVAILALAALLGKKDADKVFLPLADEDLVPLTPDSVLTAPSKGQTRESGKSWIWSHPGVLNDNLTAYENETLKIEWAKSRARSYRYQEEIQIVREEMRRTLRFFTWKEKQWQGRQTARSEDETGAPVSREHREGLVAYGARQAKICRGLRDKCDAKWTHVDSMIQMAQKEVHDPHLLKARQERERKKALLRNPPPPTTAKTNDSSGSK